MKQILTLLTLLAFFCQTIAQKQANNWLFGLKAGITFNTNPPSYITGSQMMPIETTYQLTEGTASMSDSLGNLLFYSNGEKVWNSQHSIMPNGSNLRGHASATTAAFAVPIPNSKSQFYLFTNDAAENAYYYGLRYSIIDMCLDEGRGDIIQGSKNILLLDSTCEKLTAVNHATGRGIWLITHKFRSKDFLAYLITENGITNPVVTSIGAVVTDYGALNQEHQVLGQLKASPDGNKIAMVVKNGSEPMQILDFNKSTGVLSNYRAIHLSNSGESYSLEFSPNSSCLYATQDDAIVQYNLLAGNTIAITNSRTLIQTLNTTSSLQLAPNGKIYISTPGTQSLSSIESPNSLGAACNYQANTVYIGTGALTLGLPQFISDFKYHNRLPDCSPLMQLSIQAGGVCSSACDGIATANAIGGTPPYSYLWSNGETTATAHNLCAGTHTVTITDVNGNTMLGSGSVTTQNLPSVSINNIDTICSGDSIELCANSVAVQYIWNNGATGQCIYTRFPGNYQVTVSNGASCTATASTSVAIYPVTPISTTVSGDTLRVFEGVTVQWYFNGEAIENATEHQHIAERNGTYTVVITNENGCRVQSVVMPVIAAAINDINANAGITISPNPSANGQWTLNITEQWMNCLYKLYGYSGQLISEGIVTGSQTNLAIPNAQGIYILQLSNGHKMQNIKLVTYR